MRYAQRLFHELGAMLCEPSIVFLRCHRLLPDDEQGRLHFHRQIGLAPTPSELEKTLYAYQRNTPFIHIAEALEILLSGKRLSENLAVLTFDESYQTTAQLAEPICRSLNIPACIFVTTHHAECHDGLWHDQVHRLVENIAPEPISLPWMDRILRTSSENDREKSARRIVRHLMHYGEISRKTHLKGLHDLSPRPLLSRKIDAMLKHKDIARLSRSPYFSFASHGHEHLPLAPLESERFEYELHRPREVLRQIAKGSYVDVFSYPFGHCGGVTHSEIMARIQREGYKAAFTTKKGVARPGDHLFCLPRMLISAWQNSPNAHHWHAMSEAIAALSGLMRNEKRRLLAETEN